jgi:hypothetical protein
MENKIIKIQNTPKLQAIIQKAQNENIYVVEIDGFKIQSVESFLEAIEEGFKFPIPINRELFDSIGYIEGLEFFTWLDVNGYMIVINNFKEMLQPYPKIKDDIINEYLDLYVWAWNKDRDDRVIPKQFIVNDESVMNLKAKPFNIYLVD